MKLIVKRHRVAYKQLQRDWIEWMKSKGVENPVLVSTRGDSITSLLLTYVMGSRLCSLYHGISHFQDARHRACAYSLNLSLSHLFLAHLTALQPDSLLRLASARRLGGCLLAQPSIEIHYHRCGSIGACNISSLLHAAGTTCSVRVPTRSLPPLWFSI